MQLPVQLEARRRLIRALQDSGAGIMLGSDVGGTFDNPDVYTELQALVRAGLTPYEALLAGTRNMAQYFGALDSTGTVAVGKRADLVLLPGNPLGDVSHTIQPAGVMIGGRWLARADIDRRLASSPTERRSYYGGYARRIRKMVQHPLLLLFQADTTGRLAATAEQRTSMREYRRVDVFLDSLVRAEARQTSLPPAAIRRHLRSLVAQELGETRAMLRPAQQRVFDSLARNWLRWSRTYASRNDRLTIPGVRP
jgi:hypothetical protein